MTIYQTLKTAVGAGAQAASIARAGTKAGSAAAVIDAVTRAASDLARLRSGDLTPREFIEARVGDAAAAGVAGCCVTAAPCTLGAIGAPAIATAGVAIAASLVGDDLARETVRLTGRWIFGDRSASSAGRERRRSAARRSHRRAARGAGVVMTKDSRPTPEQLVRIKKVVRDVRPGKVHPRIVERRAYARALQAARRAGLTDESGRGGGQSA